MANLLSGNVAFSDVELDDDIGLAHTTHGRP